jgi:hypothetical protein
MVGSRACFSRDLYRAVLGYHDDGLGGVCLVDSGPGRGNPVCSFVFEKGTDDKGPSDPVGVLRLVRGTRRLVEVEEGVIYEELKR